MDKEAPEAQVDNQVNRDSRVVVEVGEVEPEGREVNREEVVSRVEGEETAVSRL